MTTISRSGCTSAPRSSASRAAPGSISGANGLSGLRLDRTRRDGRACTAKALVGMRPLRLIVRATGTPSRAECDGAAGPPLGRPPKLGRCWCRRRRPRSRHDDHGRAPDQGAGDSRRRRVLASCRARRTRRAVARRAQQPLRTPLRELHAPSSRGGGARQSVRRCSLTSSTKRGPSEAPGRTGSGRSSQVCCRLPQRSSRATARFAS
jgi:hypothetical protein